MCVGLTVTERKPPSNMFAVSRLLGFQNDEATIFSQLISKKAFEKLMSIYCYAEDAGSRVLLLNSFSVTCFPTGECRH